MDTPEHGKEQVSISVIEPQGTYVRRLYFNDGHDTGIYSWSTLHELGVNYEKNWAEYLKKLEAYQLKRVEGRAVGRRHSGSPCHSGECRNPVICHCERSAAIQVFSFLNLKH